LADLAGEIEDLSIAQIAAGLDPMDDTTWLESLHVPYKIFELASSLHDGKDQFSSYDGEC